MNAATSEIEVELAGVTKRFEEGGGLTLRGIDLAVKKGELLVVVGPSGCGKSTMLRIIAGLEEASGGDVRIGGKSMTRVAPQDRDVAMVFQGYALYPQMTVRENIEFPLKMRRVDPAERKKRSDEAAALLELGRLMDRLPAELSGGERQRVAMGRAIVRRPRVFLFDEPLSNLDAALRQELRVQIGVLVRELGVTAIYVTHDQVEAMTLADRICLMKKGEIQQVAAPRAIYEEPANSFVGTFIGAPKMNLLPGVAADGAITCGPFTLSAPAGVELPAKVVVGVRPEDVKVVDAGAALEVVIAEPLGAETNLVLKAGDLTLRARTHGFDPRPPGSAIHVSLDAARFHVFDAGDRGERLA
ncbi:MAG: ABC transporter ATP-binding protein [Labilithrix sp.]|nr:ABC transporter ATP-binding protein [Labilithrix sp.]MCW5816687.1 ABC transporter ATP-binding protein [Labilithrix sp.]